VDENGVAPRIAVACATDRGARVLRVIQETRPDARLVVFSFREHGAEPRFFDRIRDVTLASHHSFLEARHIDEEAWATATRGLPVDLLIAVSWRYLIPSSVYTKASKGSFVFHDSLLPAYRGFSPTVWAIVNGRSHTGVTLFRMAEAVDSGGIVAQTRIPIGADDTIADVMETVTLAYLQLIRGWLGRLLEGTATTTPQDESAATYMRRRVLDDNRIDWRSSPERVYDLIRGVTRPYQGAFTYVNGSRLIVWRANLEPLARADRSIVAGTVTAAMADGSVVVAAGGGSVVLTEVQLSTGEACLPALVLSVGDRLG
jgi:methionyl-tRNA formyltransferase